MELTEPFDAAVVAVAHSDELVMPNGPPCLPCCRRLKGRRGLIDAEGVKAGLPSAPRRRTPEGAPRTSRSSRRRWPSLPRVFDHLSERVARRAAMRRIARSWKKLDSPVGFSKGWAEFTLKKPPPFVPVADAICEAAGPWEHLARDGVAVRVHGSLQHGGMVITAEILDHALGDEDDREIIDSGSST